MLNKSSSFQIIGQQSSSTLIRQELQTENKKMDNKKTKKIGLFSLFRFAKPLDYILMTFGTLCAIGNGVALPFFALLWGNMIDNFTSFQGLVDQTYQTLLYFIYIGIAVFLGGWIMIVCWVVTGQRQSIECKKAYMKSLLRQQIGWFDTENQFQISSQFSVDTAAFQASIDHNIPFVINVIAIAISGITIAFTKGWLMALVMISSLPVIVLCMLLYTKTVVTRETKQQRMYSETGGKAEEALFSIKTVKSLNGQIFQSKKYDDSLAKTAKGTKLHGLLLGLGLGGAFFSMLSAFALGLWFGAQCIMKTSSCSAEISRQEYTVGIAFTVVFGIIIISFHISNLPFNLRKLIQGIVAIRRIYKIIDRQPSIKPPMNGIKIFGLKGIIKFHNVSFSYPKEPQKKILNNLTMQLNKNKIAFVGESGSGKSTIFQLILRFYDPSEGIITVDGYNLKNLDLDWWREMIGYVGQEPVLFGTSIRENLLFAKPSATEKQLQDSLRKAEVWDLISNLDKKIDTFVGSGGQKQRIAIARALLRKPAILILDEATSALDRKNQKLIQNTIYKISQGIITLTIAHRIKTIMNSDQIFVVQRGAISQHGKFQELQRFKNQKTGFQQIQNIDNQQDLDLQILKKQINNETTSNKLNIKQKNKSVFKRFLVYYRGNYFLLFVTLIFSIIIAAAHPVATIWLADLVFQMLERGDILDAANRDGLILFLISVLQFFSYIIFTVTLEELGKRVTTKIRSETFYKMMKLPIYWHDRKQNNIAALGKKLSVDCFRIKQLTTVSIFVLFQMLFCLITGIVIAFIYEWRTALVQLALLPIQLLTSGFTSKYRRGAAKVQANSNTEQMISETILG